MGVILNKKLTNLAKQLRKRMTDTEVVLWNRLKNKQLDVKFRKQQPIGNFIVDFICFENKLIIELDGGQHYESIEDRKRDEWLSDNGYKVLRFWNNEVLKNIDGVLEVILREISPSPLSPPLKGGEAGSNHPPLTPPLKGGETRDTIVIGAGPAGIAAAIQLKRAGIDFLLLEKCEVGGLLLNANLVENYPGITPAISGPELVSRFKEQMEQLDIRPVCEEVLGVDTIGNAGSPSPSPSPQGRGNVKLSSTPERGDYMFTVKTNKNTYKCKNIIITSGTKAKRLPDSICNDVPSNKIFYEVYPIRDVKGKEIVIVGGGDAAFDYALYLAAKNRISILYRNRYPKCLRLLHERALSHKAIRLYPATEVTKIYSDDSELMKVITKSPSPNPSPQGRGNAEFTAPQGRENEQILTSYHILTAIGREPAVDFLSSNILSDLFEKEKTPGLFYAGDVIRGISRQTAIAVGDGVNAAMKISQSD